MVDAREKRISQYDETDLEDLTAVAEDQYMIRDLFQRRADRRGLVAEWGELPEWLKLYHTVKGLAEDYGYGLERNPYLKLINELLPKTEAEGIIPKAWLEELKDDINLCGDEETIASNIKYNAQDLFYEILDANQKLQASTKVANTPLDFLEEDDGLYRSSLL